MWSCLGLNHISHSVSFKGNGLRLSFFFYSAALWSCLSDSWGSQGSGGECQYKSPRWPLWLLISFSESTKYCEWFWTFMSAIYFMMSISKTWGMFMILLLETSKYFFFMFLMILSEIFSLLLSIYSISPQFMYLGKNYVFLSQSIHCDQT